MVSFSWQGHCESSCSSSLECRTMPNGCWPSDQVSGLGPWVCWWAAIIHTQRDHFLLLSLQTDTHFAIPQRVKGWDYLPYVPMLRCAACAQCLRAINALLLMMGFSPGIHTLHSASATYILDVQCCLWVCYVQCYRYSRVNFKERQFVMNLML